jgi:hypothetical protein
MRERRLDVVRRDALRHQQRAGLALRQRAADAARPPRRSAPWSAARATSRAGTRRSRRRRRGAIGSLSSELTNGANGPRARPPPAPAAPCARARTNGRMNGPMSADRPP